MFELVGIFFQMSVGVRLLRMPQGMLTGVSRRVSSFFWGSANNQVAPTVSPPSLPSLHVIRSVLDLGNHLL